MMVTLAWNPLRVHLLDALPKGSTFNSEYYRVNIPQNFFRLARRLMGEDSLFMLITQDPTPPENTELFRKTVRSASLCTYRNQLISHHPPSFSSDMSNIVCRESLFHNVKNYLQQFTKSSGHPAANFGGCVPALDGATRMDLSEQ
jgi:hypothetical protein